jgi:hypothetical protein
MPTKYASPLLGYNNNVRHKGKVFHIQTEDSGAKYGHIITHLFMDGGRILKSVKTSYAEYLGNDRMSDIVREMMKQQHKAMFIALRDGKFDALVEGGSGEAAQMSRPPSPPSPEAPVHPSVPSEDAVAIAIDPRAEVSAAAAVSFAEQPDEVPVTVREAPELMLDIAALERAAAATANTASPLLRGASDLPPPPANLFRERKATGKYRVAPTPASPPAVVESARPAPLRRTSVKSMTAAGDRRYAPTRPASIFGQARPQQGKSIFGEDLISDKSLDEVILSYLAEDLDEKKK